MENVSEALAWIASVNGYDYPPPALEAARTNQCPKPHGRHAGMLSCGVDSLAMLRLNHARYTDTHPHRISAAIAIKGFDCVTPTQQAQLLERAHAVGKAAGIEVLDVGSNIAEVAQWPHPTRPVAEFSRREYHACILVAAAYALSGHISSVSIAAMGVSPEVMFRQAWGSHPLIDPLYGSSSMRVFHENGTMLRFEKLRIVTEWDVGLKNLLICSNWARTELNCGQCSKCVRSMLEFIALGKLESSPFRGRSVSAASILSMQVPTELAESAWQVLVSPLEAVGRYDLARAVQQIIREYHKRRRVKAVKERAKDLDARYLGGLAVRLNRFVRNV